MRTAGGNVNQVTPAYKVGDVVEVTERNPMCSEYMEGQLVTIEEIQGDDIEVRAEDQRYSMSLRTHHVKHLAKEGFPEQARIERGYWTGQLGTDEIDTPMRSLNDATPAEWDQASKETLPWTTSIGVRDEPDNFVMSEALLNVVSEMLTTNANMCGTGVISIGDGLATNVPGEDEPDGFDIPDLNLQAANPLDTQIGGDHYRHMEIQPIEFITSNKLGWCEGHVVKYVSRHASKGGKQDLEKAKHYIDMLIEEVYYDE